MKQALEAAQKYQSWMSALKKAGIEIHGVEVLQNIHKSNGELIFSLLRLDATAPEGFKLLPVAFLRGHFVAVLTCLIDRDTKERFLLLVRQRRIANGEWFYEHPAGMMDSETDPLKVAMKELEEETGLKVAPENIHQLNEEPLYASPGIFDEAGYFYYTEVELSREEIQSYQNKETGAEGENENILTSVVSVTEAKHLIKNAMGLLHIFIYLEQKTQNPNNRGFPQKSG